MVFKSANNIKFPPFSLEVGQFREGCPPEDPFFEVSISMIQHSETFDKQKIQGLVNRKRVIKTLEDKANITGFRWTRPKQIPEGFVDNRSKNGKFLHDARTLPIDILDVDGHIKHTIRTDYYAADKRTPHPKMKTAYGVYAKYLANTYHGSKSCNWHPENLTLEEIIAVLNAGAAFAPGYFNPPIGESQRSAKYCQYRQIILSDADEWNTEHPPPANIEELIYRYPDIVYDFYWVGESISSRSSLKPELRLRLMAVLPIPIYKDGSFLWEVAIDYFVAKYPFIARGPGIDKVRLSFGNARPECENRVLGGIISLETFTEWKEIAAEKQAKAEALTVEQERKTAERKASREKEDTLKVELKKRGHSLSTDNRDPIYEFCEIDPARLLVELGLATHLSGREWNWHESSPGRSFELTNEGVLKIYSNTMQSAAPESDPIKPVEAHRYILYYLYKLDISKKTDQHQLRCLLADNGYGTHPDDYRKSKQTLKITGVKEGLISPLELRSAAPPLPEDKIQQTLRKVEENAPLIAQAFREKKKRVVGLRAGTGEGKTEGGVSYAVDGGSLAMSLNSIPLAEQVYARFVDAETLAFLWRSRWHGYQNDSDDDDNVPLMSEQDRIRAFYRGEILCIRAELCEASRARGVPARVSICPPCPMFEECKQTRYLAQTTEAQATQVLCIAQPKLFIDPHFSGFFKELSKGQPNDRICVIDEAKAHEMFIDCSLSKEVLQQWVRDWAGESLGDFAAKVLDVLEVRNATPYTVAELVGGLTDQEMRRLSRQCIRYRLPYQRIERGATEKDTLKVLAHHSVGLANGVSAYVAVDYEAYEALQNKGLRVLQPQEVSESGSLTLTPAQAYALGVYSPTDIDAIYDLPRLWEQSNWTPFQQLKRFALRYQRAADAPIWYHKGILHWVIPPVVHSRVKHLVCMSATLQREAFGRAFDTTPHTFIETPPTKCVDGTKTFQIRTGAYPRTSLLKYSADWKKILGLSRTGTRFISLIETEIERDRDIKHVIITFKAIEKRVAKKLKQKHPNLIDVLTFHKMEGIDFKDSGLVFWILGCPDVPIDVIKQRAQILYGNDTEPLNYERDPETGDFRDRRLQLCWEGEVTSLLKQAVGRARLNWLANTVIVFSNVLIPDFTGRAVGFVPEDLEVAGGLENLTEVAFTRQKAESEADSQQKTKRKRETEARDLKAEQKQMALELYAARLPVDEIANRVGRSPRTIFNWVDECDF